MLNYIVDRISRFFKLKKVKIKFADFKMADDIQLKQMLGNLVTGQKLSLKSYVQEFGYNLETEQRQIIEETAFTNKLQKIQLLGQADAQAEALQISGRGQVKAQIDQQKSLKHEQEGDFIEQLKGTMAARKDQAAEQAQQAQQAPQQPQQTQQTPQTQQAEQPKQEAPQTPQAQQAGSHGDNGQNHQEFADSPIDPRFLARQFAVQLNAVTPLEKDRILESMKRNTPNLYELVKSQRALIQQQHQSIPVSKPNPEAKPPRRTH